MVRFRGQKNQFDNVPAEVCSACGDVLLRPEKQMLRTRAQPARTVPLYEYASAGCRVHTLLRSPGSFVSRRNQSPSKLYCSHCGAGLRMTTGALSRR